MMSTPIATSDLLHDVIGGFELETRDRSITPARKLAISPKPT